MKAMIEAFHFLHMFVTPLDFIVSVLSRRNQEVCYFSALWRQVKHLNRYFSSQIYFPDKQDSGALFHFPEQFPALFYTRR